MLLAKTKSFSLLSRSTLISNVHPQISTLRFAKTAKETKKATLFDELKKKFGLVEVGKVETETKSSEETVAEKRYRRLFLDENITNLPRPIGAPPPAVNTTPVRPIKVFERKDHGGPSCVRSRKLGFVPGVIFGGGKEIFINVYKTEIDQYVRSNIGFLGHVYTLHFGDGKTVETVTPAQIQRDLTGTATNVTFFRKSQYDKKMQKKAAHKQTMKQHIIDHQEAVKRKRIASVERSKKAIEQFSKE